MLKPLFAFMTLALITPSAFAARQGAYYRGGAEFLNPKAYSITGTAMMFQTSGYYNYQGTEYAIPDGYKYSSIDADLGLTYGVSKNLEVTASARFRKNSSTTGELTVEKTGPESLAAEIKYGFENTGSAHYAIGAHYRQTLYSNVSYDTTMTVPTDEIILGDAGSEYGADLYMTYIVNSTFKLDGKAGYSSPANSMSGEIGYKLEGSYRFTSFGLLGGVEGIYSLKQDEFTDDISAQPRQAVGATALFHSVNREKVVPYLGGYYAFDKILLTVKGGTVVKGVSTDKGSYGLIGLTFTSGGVTPESVKIDSFKEYQIDGSVLKVSARGNFIRIDQGLSTDVEKGMKFDIYQTDYFGGNVLVASGIVYDVGSDWSVIKLVKKYKEIEIKPGFAARGY
jgi:hypothetical protein